jgi:hypothetical protein
MVWSFKWVDSKKHGFFGYRLTNDTIGVIFNDLTRGSRLMIWVYEYLNKNIFFHIFYFFHISPSCYCTQMECKFESFFVLNFYKLIFILSLGPFNMLKKGAMKISIQ